MNKALVIALAALVSGEAWAQGTFNFNNLYYASGVLPGVSAPISAIGNDASDPLLADNNI